jgi:hypothetical protein
MKRRQFLRRVFGASGILCLPKVKAASNSICLLQAYIAGYQYYQGESIQQLIAAGDELTLLPESDNPYDSLAVQIFWQEVKLGYIPRRYNGVIAQLLSRQQPLTARVIQVDVSRPSWKRIKLDVRL